MSPALILCPSCARHVRADESSCPFCAAALAPHPRPRAVEEAPLRLARAALLASALSAAACGGAASSAPESASVASSYGGAPASGSSAEPVADDACAAPEASAPAAIAIYGAPPAKDER